MDQNSANITSGLVWIEGGKLRVRGPGPGGAPARIRPCYGVEVIVDGVKISGETEITAKSNVILRPLEEPPQVSFKFQISKDDLEAYVLLDVKDGIRFRLKDTQPSNVLQLEVETEVIPASLDPKTLIDGAEKAGIKFGLDTDACHMVCREKPAKPVLIASGVPPTQGHDGKLEFLVPMEKVVELPLDEVRVDFRSSVRIPDVRAGQTIAIKIPAKPGLPGKGVSGRPLQPKPPRDPKLRAGKGVELKCEGELVLAVATSSGWPRYNESTGIVEVDEVYYHKGDVDLSSGNLKTSGSIEIAGNVLEGMKVESEGNQTINGTVTDAELNAWGSITIRGNVFKSRISAGKDVKWLQKWNELVSQVEENILRIMELRAIDKRLAEEAQTVRHLTQSAAATGSSDALFDYFRQLVISLSNLYKEDLSQLPKEVSQRIAATKEKITGREGDVFQRALAVEEDIMNVKSWIEYELLRGESDIIVPYVQSSYLQAARDIIVTGQGAVYSTLSAGRAVKITGNPGVVRGGEVTASELIQVNEAGGRGSATTILRVSEKGKIVARLIHPNTTLILGRLKARTENPLESVEIRMIDDRLFISSRTGAVTMDGSDA